MANRVADTVEAPVAEAGANGTEPSGRVLLSLDDILAAHDIVTEDVEVPEWGGTVRVISLTGEERNRIGAAMKAHAAGLASEDEAVIYFQVRVVAASLVNERDERIVKPAQALVLARKSAAALQRVWNVCARLSGLGEDEVQRRTDDLKATPSASSGTD